ncbi:MAG: hypothetical protein ACFFBD_19420 [Candidatus Hodarchaeota archaeon]
MAEYEFTKEENMVFSALYKRMLIMAIVIFTGGTAAVVQLLFGPLEILLLAEGILYFIMAITFYLPVDNLRNIVSTEGSDISELMQALKEMDKGWLIVNAVTLVIVGVRILLLLQALGVI